MSTLRSIRMTCLEKDENGCDLRGGRESDKDSPKVAMKARTNARLSSILTLTGSVPVLLSYGKESSIQFGTERWRMFAVGEEESPQIDNLNTVKLQGCHRGPSGGCQTDNLAVVGGPSEVVRPFLPPGMEQRDEFVRDGIVAFDLGVFVIITALA